MMHPIENRTEQLFRSLNIIDLYPIFRKEFKTIDVQLLKQFTPIYDTGLSKMGLTFDQRLQLYAISKQLRRRKPLSFASRIVKNARRIDNLIPTVIIQLFGLIEGAFSFVCALAWNEVLKKNIERNESWSEMTWAWVTMGIFSLVVIILELIKLLFISEVKLLLASNDAIVHQTHHTLQLHEDTLKDE